MNRDTLWVFESDFHAQRRTKKCYWSVWYRMLPKYKREERWFRREKDSCTKFPAPIMNNSSTLNACVNVSSDLWSHKRQERNAKVCTGSSVSVNDLFASSSAFFYAETIMRIQLPVSFLWSETKKKQEERLKIGEWNRRLEVSNRIDLHVTYALLLFGKLSQFSWGFHGLQNWSPDEEGEEGNKRSPHRLIIRQDDRTRGHLRNWKEEGDRKYHSLLLPSNLLGSFWRPNSGTPFSTQDCLTLIHFSHRFLVTLQTVCCPENGIVVPVFPNPHPGEDHDHWRSLFQRSLAMHRNHRAKYRPVSHASLGIRLSMNTLTSESWTFAGVCAISHADYWTRPANMWRNTREQKGTKH